MAFNPLRSVMSSAGSSVGWTSTDAVMDENSDAHIKKALAIMTVILEDGRIFTKRLKVLMPKVGK